MGWDCISNRPGVSALDMLRDYSSFYEGNSWDGSNGLIYRVEKMAQGAGGAYGVLAREDCRERKTNRIALVIAIQRRGKDFCWKAMSELDGPVVCGMPAGLLKHLTSVELLDGESAASKQHAANWRARVLARGTNSLAKVKVGDTLEFDRPLSFFSGKVHVNRFKVTAWGRKKAFQALPAQGATFSCSLRRDSFSDSFKVLAAVTP